MTSPSPSQLWRAAVDKHPRDPLAARDAYRASMLEFGYIEPGMPSTLPCGWTPHRAERTVAEVRDEYVEAHPPVYERGNAVDRPDPVRSFWTNGMGTPPVPQPCQPEFDLIDHQPLVRVWPIVLVIAVALGVYGAVVALLL